MKKVGQGLGFSRVLGLGSRVQHSEAGPEECPELEDIRLKLKFLLTLGTLYPKFCILRSCRVYASGY